MYGDYSSLHVLQGKQHYLGIFPDPVTAAICYDRAASRAHGTAAVLNFPPGRKPGPNPTGGVQSPVLQGAGRPGQEGTATNASLPAGTPTGKAKPVRAYAGLPLVNFTSCLGTATSLIHVCTAVILHHETIISMCGVCRRGC